LESQRLNKELKAALCRELKEYLAAIGTLTEDEKKELRKWVAVGNSVNDNPYMLYDESGWPMDFINGCRISNDICTIGDD